MLEGTDACVTAVLDWNEAPLHAHNKARQAYISVDGVMQPAPAPRFSRTRNEAPTGPAQGDAQAVLRGWGINQPAIDALATVGAI